MSAEQILRIPECEECRRLWLTANGERWQAYWIDDRSEDRLVFYCPDCAEREFGG
jgi:hypothetical protein